MKLVKILCLFIVIHGFPLSAQENIYQGKFEQLGPLLPTPNQYRAASGAPGEAYWQQKADYDIQLELDDEQQRIEGEEQITYYNYSPNSLRYLWVQLDQNRRSLDSDTYKALSQHYGDALYFNYPPQLKDSISGKEIQALLSDFNFDGGFKIESVSGDKGRPLNYFINNTMMRIELPRELKSGDSFTFSIKWWYNINDRMYMWGRSGYEYFPEDGNYLYTIAQFYPRMAVYDDVNGWQNKQFFGKGEFALPFGDFSVSITVPADHIVASTGTLQNPKKVLSKEQLQRLEEASKTYDKPVMIVNEEEARENELKKTAKKKTWIFQADSVRDFAFATSRKFIWDAMAVELDTKKPLAMSFYPKEGNPLWEEYSTRVVSQTLETYSKHTIEYPYPVAISVHTASIGMEYPMICFNYGRPNKDGSYSEALKYGMISVIIHEVGHNFFPMIINSDERQWTWMDEGLNTFLQYLTEKEWDSNYPSRRGPPKNIVYYMKGSKDYIRPIMTNSESIIQFGNNAYGKPATALNILRETIMGRELFDYAFKEYAKRWAFKHPTPADFFRTMEDASAEDLDWFWRGWFFGTDHVDLSIEEVIWYKFKQDKPELEGRSEKGQITQEGAASSAELPDEGFEEIVFKNTSEREYREFINRLDDEKLKARFADKNFYEMTFRNEGGLPMPIIVELKYKDGTSEVRKVPAQIWRYDEAKVTKIFATDKEVASIKLDPFQETADTDDSDNIFPREEAKSRFDKFKNGGK